jgi:ABC-type spermidine/putrescine transport system permease subunit II
MGLREEDPEQERHMEMIGNSLRIAAGATLLSATIYLILAIPGFVSDRDSTVPIHDLQETRR